MQKAEENGPKGASRKKVTYSKTMQSMQTNWESRELQSRQSCVMDDELPPPSIVAYLIQADFYGVSRVGHFEYSRLLIRALVESGFVVTGTEMHNYRALCMELLGVELLQQQQTRKGQRLSMNWLKSHFQHTPDHNSPEVYKQRYTRQYILHLLGMFTTARPGTTSQQKYRQIINQMDECCDIDWISYSLMLERGQIPNEYHSDHVLRQFGMTHSIPGQPRDLSAVHDMSLRNRSKQTCQITCNGTDAPHGGGFTQTRRYRDTRINCSPTNDLMTELTRPHPSYPYVDGRDGVLCSPRSSSGQGPAWRRLEPRTPNACSNLTCTPCWSCR
ncbi:serine/threonine-protein phosphatase 7 long form-like protein [Senna tora]|uniref:Serine/threonine-protein phosphatase 7 long form-like protein n=1 Tax=Senna tora TaxID=362788 RepID=A0A834XCK2_9FABA|nr:serine/threonine-protein phosphatase 7 long form-like protein [Senna tora]